MLNPLNAFITLALLVGIILLQIFLSHRESRWPGLVLPILSFLFSLVYPLNMIAFPDVFTGELVVQIILIWLTANIPTCILLAIYFACREKYRRKKQLEKMHIQDLDG